MKEDNNMRLLILLSFIAFVMLITSCENPYEGEGSHWTEEWIATMNLDGSEVAYLFKNDGAIPFFVTDLQNPEQEKIILSYQDWVEIMNTDGTERDTIIYNVGNVVNLNRERTRMLLEFSGDIYLANVDGSELTNMTDTPEVIERDVSFFPYDGKILYNYHFNINDSLRKRVVAYKDIVVMEEIAILESEGLGFIGYGLPILDDYDNVFLRIGNGVLNPTTGLYKTDLLGNNVEFIKSGAVNDIVYNYFSIVAFSLSDTLYFYDVINENLNQWGYIGSNCKPIFSNDGNWLFVGSVAYRLSKVINWQSGEEITFDLETNYPSFNNNDTRVVCRLNRYHPEDF